MHKVDADRNLLFGIPALQMDFISQQALIGAMNAWAVDKERPLGQILQDRGALDAEHRGLLEPLVQAHLKLHGNGAERSLAAISSADAIRQQLDRLVDPEVQASLAHGGHSRAPADDVDRTLPQPFGAATSTGLRFRILRPHAMGGLGAVFIAHDAELHREAALRGRLRAPTQR
jgi:hypothetical protein